MKYLTKVKILNNYKNEECNIYIGEIYYDFLIDLRSIDFNLKYFEDGDQVHQPAIIINDYFNINDLAKNNKDRFYTRNNTHREEFYLYQNIHSYYEIDIQLFLGYSNGDEEEDEDKDKFEDYLDDENDVENNVDNCGFFIYTKFMFF